MTFPEATIKAIPQSVRDGFRWVRGHPQWVVGVFCVFLLLTGWMLRGTYGLSMDEMPLMEFGRKTWEYFFAGGPAPSAIIDWKFHSPLVQVGMYQLVRSFHISTAYDFLLLKRFYSFCLFSLGWLSFVFLARRLLQSWWWAILGGLWMILSPRLFAHAFYNPKDVPTLTFFTLGVLLLVRLLERPTILRVLLFGLAAGFAISLRSSALLLPCFALLFTGFHAWDSRGGERVRWILVTCGTVMAVILLTMAVWPLLWHDPFRNFLQSITSNISRGDSGFYMGSLANPRHPWHYLAVWMGITIPVAYTVLFLLGAGVTCAWAFRHPFALLRESPVAVLALLWIGIPVAARQIGGVGLFDEWRHILFIYPAFLLLALLGFRWLLDVLRARWMRVTAAALLVFNMSFTGLWMVRNFSLAYMYFSVPAAWAQGRMDLDYWGLSHRDGLRWILAHDPRPVVSVYIRDTDGVVSATTLPAEELARLRVMKKPDHADYILDTLRWSAYRHIVPPDRIVHTFAVDGLTFLWIYRGPYVTDKFPVYDWCTYCAD